MPGQIEEAAHEGEISATESIEKSLAKPEELGDEADLIQEDFCTTPVVLVENDSECVLTQSEAGA